MLDDRFSGEEKEEQEDEDEEDDEDEGGLRGGFESSS